MNERQLKKSKSKEKGKERRTALKAERARLAAAQLLVNQANAMPDPLSKFPFFNKYERNGLSCTLICKRVKDLDPDMLEWAIDLCKQNMQPLYEKSTQGWHENEKREEMMEDAAWYLMAIDTTSEKAVAFSHFRFDMDYGDEVLYCYELQLEADCRNKGLGKFMMQVLELMAFSNQMHKVVLTVFKHNPDGMAFFTKCKYEIDETSPEDTYEGSYDYNILSKLNKMKPTQKTSL
ncbi:N-alpha-acetyltransferase 40-like [Homarus americanus]|uniref:N-alpha-acetyltransferase 40 n=1 Tax=Homarus americanus TaxID=6706 RepID=A0A8J5NBQ1_HOMAM|nr:N-alpha-acetyltransferase 40-like [Homarus americanus]KAG7177055.1 N-alpha-acetyltransferase 40-like [Homarus americanus]